MSLVKDLVDLITQLDQSVTDRRVRDMVLPIKEKALEVQREHLAIETKLLESERKAFDREQRHAKEISDINEQALDLKKQHDQTVSGLNEQIAKLKRQLDTEPVLHHGLRWDARLNPHCPVCRSPLQLMNDSRFCHCTKCKHTFEFRTPDGEMTFTAMQELIRNTT